MRWFGHSGWTQGDLTSCSIASCANLLARAIRFRHSFLARYLFCIVALTSKFLATLRHLAQIDPYVLNGSSIFPSDYQLIPCLNPTFKILSSKIDHLIDPPTFEALLIIPGQITFFHLNLISSGDASSASDSRSQFMIPDYTISNFSFLSSRSVQPFFQVNKSSQLSPSKAIASFSLPPPCTSFTFLPLLPALQRVLSVGISCFNLPCHRLMMELIDRMCFMYVLTNYHFIPYFLTPSRRS